MNNDNTTDSSLFSQVNDVKKTIEDKPSVNHVKENTENQHVDKQNEFNSSIKKEVEKIIIFVQG